MGLSDFFKKLTSKKKKPVAERPDSESTISMMEHPPTQEEYDIAKAEIIDSEESERRMKQVKDIVDDIEAELVDDPADDYKYLKGAVEKYKENELYSDIIKELAGTMYGKIPSMALKGLNNGLTDDAVATYNMLIDESRTLMLNGRWGAAITMLSNLIGEGISVTDNDKNEYRNFDEEVERLLYENLFKDEKC